MLLQCNHAGHTKSTYIDHVHGYLAHAIAEYPLRENIQRGCQWNHDQQEEEIRNGQVDDKIVCGVFVTMPDQRVNHNSVTQGPNKRQ